MTITAVPIKHIMTQCAIYARKLFVNKKKNERKKGDNRSLARELMPYATI